MLPAVGGLARDSAAVGAHARGSAAVGACVRQPGRRPRGRSIVFARGAAWQSASLTAHDTQPGTHAAGHSSSAQHAQHSTLTSFAPPPPCPYLPF
eukprot:360262-Chlamydomonas_euryale.AAC.3